MVADTPAVPPPTPHQRVLGQIFHHARIIIHVALQDSIRSDSGNMRNNLVIISSSVRRQSMQVSGLLSSERCYMHQPKAAACCNTICVCSDMLRWQMNIFLVIFVCSRENSSLPLPEVPSLRKGAMRATTQLLPPVRSAYHCDDKHG